MLDLLFCNDPLFLSTVMVTPPFSTSDHATIMFSAFIVNYDARLNNDTDAHFELRCDWNRAEWDALMYFFSEIDWNNEYSTCVNSNELITALLTKMYEGINLFVPIKSTGTDTEQPKKNCSKICKETSREKTFVLASSER